MTPVDTSLTPVDERALRAVDIILLLNTGSASYAVVIRALLAILEGEIFRDVDETTLLVFEDRIWLLFSDGDL